MPGRWASYFPAETQDAIGCKTEMDPIVHREELRELCRQFLGRVALSYSANGLGNPAAAIALEAQADPLLLGNSTDVHLQLLE